MYYGVSLSKSENIVPSEIYYLGESRVALEQYGDAFYPHESSNQDTIYGNIDSDAPIICADGVGGSKNPKIASLLLTQYFSRIKFDDANSKRCLQAISDACLDMETNYPGKSGSSTLTVIWVKKIEENKTMVKFLNIGDCQSYFVVDNKILSINDTPKYMSSSSEENFSDEISFEQNHLIRSSGNSKYPVPFQIDLSKKYMTDKYVFYSYEKDYGTTHSSSISESIDRFYSEYLIESDNLKVFIMSDGLYDNLSEFEIRQFLEYNIIRACNQLFVKAVLTSRKRRILMDAHKLNSFLTILLFKFMKEFPNSKFDYSSKEEYDFVLKILNEHTQFRVETLDEIPIGNFYDTFSFMADIVFRYAEGNYWKYGEFANYILKFFSYKKMDDISIIAREISFTKR